MLADVFRTPSRDLRPSLASFLMPTLTALGLELARRGVRRSSRGARCLLFPEVVADGLIPADHETSEEAANHAPLLCLLSGRHHPPVAVLGRCIHKCPPILEVQRKTHHLDNVRQIGLQAACRCSTLAVACVKQYAIQYNRPLLRMVD